MKKLFNNKMLCAVLFPIFFSGCSSWNFYEVESSFHLSELKNLQPSIIETSSYKGVIGSVTTIAVRAPDGCANETQSQSSGLDASSNVLLRETCGQEMSAIERGLAKSGYRVISWQVVENKARADHSTALDVARGFSADVLLEVNSLERTRTRPGIEARWERRYYVTNKACDKREKPAELTQQISSQIESYAKAAEKAVGAARLSASINVTATSTRTGEAIWFYDWSLSDDGNSDEMNHLKTFAACSKKRPICKPYAPRGRAVKPTTTTSTGSSEAVSTSMYSDEERAIHNMLVSKIIGDMVSRLKAH